MSDRRLIYKLAIALILITMHACGNLTTPAHVEEVSHTPVLPTETGVSLTPTSQPIEAYPFRGLFPSDVDITPDGKRAFVTCFASSNVLVIDTNSNQVIDAIDLSAAGPFGMNVIDAAMTPDGGKIYLADQITGKIGVIDTKTNQVTAFVDVEEEWVRGQGKRVEVTPDGKYAYITFESNRVDVIDVEKDIVVKTIVLAEEERIYLVGFSSDSSRAFLISQDGRGKLYTVDVSTYAVLGRINLGIGQTLQTQASLAVSPDGKMIYLTSGFNEGATERPDIGTNRVFVIDLVSQSLVDEIEVIGGPHRIRLSADGTIAYVSTATATKVFVLDLVSRTVIDEFDWNGIYEESLDFKRYDLRGIAILPDGKSAYLVGWDADAIILLDIPERRVTGTIALNPMVGAAPAAVTITPYRNKMYISTWGWFGSGVRNGIAVIDTENNSVIKSIPLEGGEPRRMDTALDGRFLYVAADPVLVVDTTIDEVVASIFLGKWSAIHDVAIVSGQNKLYVSYGSVTTRGGISVIDLSSNTIEKDIDVGWRPTTIAVTPDGSRLYVNRIVNPNDIGELVVIDTATDQVIATIASPINSREKIGTIGDFTSALAVTPDGAHVYWTTGWRWISIVEVASNTVMRTIDVGEALPSLPIAPSSIAFLSDGSRAYIACWDAGHIVVLDTATSEFVGVIRPGFRPVGIAITPNDGFAYVANQYSEDVSVIDLATNEVIDTIPLRPPP